MKVHWNPSALIVTEREQSARVLQACLAQAGFREVGCAATGGEALTAVARTLPHLIVVEGDLSDMSALTLVGRLRSEKRHARMGIIAVRALNKEEILKFVEAKITGILPKPLEPQQAVTKFKEFLARCRSFSPYALALDGAALKKGGQVRVKALAVARHGDMLVCNAQFAGGAGLQCVLAPTQDVAARTIATLVQSEPLPQRQGLCTLHFDLATAIGRNRPWLASLAVPAGPGPGGSESGSRPQTAAAERRVLLYDTRTDNVAPIAAALRYHGVEVDAVASVQALAAKWGGEPGRYPVVYFGEPLMGASGMAWSKGLERAPAEQRPLEVVATSAQTQLQKPNTVFLQKPFGLDRMLQAFDLGFARRSRGEAAPAVVAAARPGAAPAGIPLLLSLPLRILAIDERGVIVETAAAGMSEADLKELVFDLGPLAGLEPFRQVRAIPLDDKGEAGVRGQCLRLMPADGQGVGDLYARLEKALAEGGFLQTLS